MSQKGRDSEAEYRIHLRQLQARDPSAFAGQMAGMQQEALAGLRARGRGLLVSLDDGLDGCLVYVPTETADLQFGPEAGRLCRTYDPETQWLLMAFTNGECMVLAMDWTSEQGGPGQSSGTT